MPDSNIVEIIKTPLFWVISAVGSVVFSIIGNLVTPKVADLISKRSHRKRNKETYRRAKFLGEVALRIEDKSKIVGTKLDSLHAFLLACFCMLFALILFTAATALDWLFFPEFIRIGIAILSIPVIWLSFFLASHGLRSHKIAIAAEKRIAQEKKLSNPENPDTRSVWDQMSDWDQEEFGITLDQTRDLMAERINTQKPQNQVPRID